MDLGYLDDKDLDIVNECLKCVAKGEVIKHDWEFSSLFGLEVSEFVAIVERWPSPDCSDEKADLAIHGAFLNLLGYPHGNHEQWDEWMPYSIEEVRAAEGKWRAGRTDRI